MVGSTQRKRILIFDTTLRDGEQSPGASLTTHEKLIIARQLARLRVDVIEAGFPVVSDGDFKAVKAIAQNVKGPVICGLARAAHADIDRCWEAIKYASHPRIHTFIATSSIHLENKLQKSEEEVISLVKQAVTHARSYCDDVEFSPEDSTRTGFEYLCNIVRAAIQSGATTINIPDTVGYAVPEEFGGRIKRLLSCVPECEDICLSVHCHNDLGNAVANSLAAINKGATQVECCINGIGERAGNAATEEVVMNLITRKDYFNAQVYINIQEIFRTSRLVSRLTRLDVQRNKAIVGENAFAHEAGIHQHGVLCNKKTYEIMTPSLIGWIGKGLVIGKHSGKHAIKVLLKEEGYDPTPQQLSVICGKVKKLADNHKQIERDDIIAIANDVIHQLSDEDRIITLHEFIVTTGNRVTSTASVRMSINGEEKIGASTGVGSVDALSNAIQAVIDPSLQLIEFNLRAITGGTDALADVSITFQDHHMNFFSAGAVDEDIVRASALAIIKGANKALIYQKKRIERGDHEGN